MAYKGLLSKQRPLTDQETQTSFESWRESMIFHISLSDKSARFLSTGDLKTWTTAEGRGFADDGEAGTGDVTVDNKMNKVAKAALLNIVLGSIATYCPVISAKFVKKQSTSLDSIWCRLRSYYGFRRAGSRILELSELKPDHNESRESLWERLYSFIEDQLLTRDGAVIHEGIKRENDEEFTPTLLNVLVTIWLQALHPSLPGLVKQKFATQLRSCTVYSLREEISDSIPTILSEMEEKECNISRFNAYQGKQAQGGYQSRGRYQKNNQYKNQSFRKRSCSLCIAAGKSPSDHFLSACPYLSVDDQKHISRSRLLTLQDDGTYEGDDDYEEDSQNVGRLNVNLNDMSMNQPSQHPVSGSGSSPIQVGRIDVFASPVLNATVNDVPSRWTLDSGSESDCITEEEALRLKLKWKPTSHTATQGDGKTPLNTIGEIHFVAWYGHHRLIFNGLVVKNLQTPILAGMPFHIVNNVQVNYCKSVIILDDCCRVKFDPQKGSRRKHAPNVLRVTRQTCVLPGEGVSFQLPESMRHDEIVAIEPRITVPKDMPEWVQCELAYPDEEGCVVVKNSTSEPVLISRHTQVCQARKTTAAETYMKSPQPPQESLVKESASEFNVHSVIDLSVDSRMSVSEKETFKTIHEQYSSVFSPGIGLYNNYSGEFSHVINMSPNLPPQRRGRIPDYSKSDKELLQDTFDYLLSEGVFSRAEDVGQPVEFVHPSFLVKKASGGHRLVTSFGEMATYCRAQPTVNSNVEHALHQIGQYEEIIIADLKNSYYQLRLPEESAKYVGVITPYKGTYVYRRSVMGLPGSEAALEEILSRIFGDLIRDGKMVKLADDLVMGGQSVQEVTEVWREVLKRLQLNGMKLSPSKTKICPTTASILGWEWESGSIRPGNHRINALLSCDPPDTVKGLRSYLGCFKYISRVLPKYGEILHPLEDIVAGELSADKIVWTEELLASFSKSKEHLKKVRAIVLPKRSDQLHLVTDASSRGLAGTLYVVRNNKPSVAGFFSAALKRNQSKLSTCELEALSIAANLKHFSYQIRQSTRTTRILTDSRPCCLAYKKLQRGEYSSSPKMTTFLSVASQFAVEMLHISGSSNMFSDFASRNPVVCNSSNCSVCAFIDETCNAAVGEVTVSDVLSGRAKVPFSTKYSWGKIQQSCPDLSVVHKLLTTGASLPKKNRKLTTVRRYMNCGISVLTNNLEGLLVIKQSTPFKHTSVRVVIPKAASDGLLTALHIELNHPSVSQLKQVFTRGFFCLDLSEKAKCVSEQCFTCAALKNIPAAYHEQSTSVPADTIANKFSADVVRRSSQFILLVREDITSYTDATLVRNEQAETLRDGLVLVLSRLKSLIGSTSIIRTDPATSLQSLHNDGSLQKFNLRVELGEAKNVNKNPIAESAVKELHAELVRLQPRGGKITDTTLAQAVSGMNNIIRQNKLSAREAWTKRDMHTGEELDVEDSKMIKQKYDQRCGNHESSASYKARGKPPKPLPEVELGQLAHLYSDRSKLKRRDKYLVTAVEEKEVTLQKFTKDQFRNKEYRVKKSDLIVLPQKKSVSLDTESGLTNIERDKLKASLDDHTPVIPPTPALNCQPTIFSSDSSSSEDSDDDYMPSSSLRLFLANSDQRRVTRSANIVEHSDEATSASDISQESEADDVNLADLFDTVEPNQVFEVLLEDAGDLNQAMNLGQKEDAEDGAGQASHTRPPRITRVPNRLEYGHPANSGTRRKKRHTSA